MLKNSTITATDTSHSSASVVYADAGSGGASSGAGMQEGVSYQLHNVEVKPYVELAYVGQFGAETDFHTDDYRLPVRILTVVTPDWEWI
ncbi:autotransporter [Salmonella enterica subsp. arizonae]|uniref:Autotransporter n=1 Tax=Salmonella enterica subsp. arizonae TaxID=59203 RepID=A0A447R8U1_SALER|nr:autotransporter [Salmonella enterica subsp. arizonae]